MVKVPRYLPVDLPVLLPHRKIHIVGIVVITLPEDVDRDLHLGPDVVVHLFVGHEDGEGVVPSHVR